MTQIQPIFCGVCQTLLGYMGGWGHAVQWPLWCPRCTPLDGQLEPQ